jgi:hypothetical protein
MCRSVSGSVVGSWVLLMLDGLSITKGTIAHALQDVLNN